MRGWSNSGVVEHGCFRSFLGCRNRWDGTVHVRCLRAGLKWRDVVEYIWFCHGLFEFFPKDVESGLYVKARERCMKGVKGKRENKPP